MRDLEIRGAGNLLGDEQSGHVAAVGFELYCEMLDDAVRSLEEREGDEADRETWEPVRLDVPVDAYIPADYVPYEVAKIDIHRRIAATREPEELARLEDELRDRFGEPPEPVLNLIKLQEARIKLGRAGARTVEFRSGRLVVAPVALDLEQARELRERSAGGRLRIAQKDAQGSRSRRARGAVLRGRERGRRPPARACGGAISRLARAPSSGASASPRRYSFRALLRRPKLLSAIAIAAVLAAGLSACGDDGGNVPTNAVANVDGEPITNEEFDHWIKVVSRTQQQQDPTANKKQTPKLPKPGSAEYKQLASQVMQFLISSRWIAGEAARQGPDGQRRRGQAQLRADARPVVPDQEGIRAVPAHLGSDAGGHRLPRALGRAGNEGPAGGHQRRAGDLRRRRGAVLQGQRGAVLTARAA